MKSLVANYRESEYPALNAQIKNWCDSKVFSGVKILDATPVFRNTVCKYLALLAGGAELTVGFGNGVPFSEEIVKSLADFGIRAVGNGEAEEEFDLVLDCGGVNRSVRAKSGYVELTRSGAYYYENCDKPVMLIDDSRIKEIETSLGTGDGFYRAMKQLGHSNLLGKKVVIFGYGKVGRGIANAVLRHAGTLAVVEQYPSQIPPGVKFIAHDDHTAIENEIQKSFCVVSATGIRHALAGSCEWRKFFPSHILFANMGVEDEFGPDMPTHRVLNGKQPLNFILPEPTELKYIDPALALSNRAALGLLNGDFPPGLNKVKPEWEEEILSNVMGNGEIAAELKTFLNGK